MTFSAAHSLFAQQCYITYAPSLSSYTNLAIDETNIYTAVGVDGNGVMTTSGSCPNLSSIYHYSIILNSIGGVSSGWVSGSQTCPDCYISDEQDEQLPYDPSATYTFNWEADVSCSMAGTFFSTFGNIPILELRTAFWGPPVSISPDGTCYWGSLACNAGTTPTCTTGKGIPLRGEIGCPDYIRATWVVTIDLTTGKATCQVPVLTKASGPGDCN